MRKSRLFALLVATAAAVAVVVPTTAGAVSTCTNKYQFSPDFVTLGDSNYFRPGNLNIEAAAWMWKEGGTFTVPVAILTSSLPAAVQQNRLWQTWAGDYTVICNATSNLAPLTISFASTYVDNNGKPIPAIPGWYMGAKMVPGVLEVWKIG